MTVAASAPTRQRLLDATTELLAEGGYAAATVAALTTRAGVASGTLYRHFSSKEELFVEVFRSLSGRELAAMREAAEGDSDPLDRLEAAIDTFARRALAEPRVAWALIAEPVDALVDAERLEYRRRYRDLVAEHALNGSLTLAAAIVGGVGEALVGPLSDPPTGTRERDSLIAELKAFARRAATP
ncbi:MAG: TetR/AcrR family transcriptional regulator [Thermoleophilaceae bacterium]|nr:TetR/AcrR family transcriptional regulator [Thermoleophilaceae bacterium]